SALGAVAARLREGGVGIVVSAQAPNEEVYLLRRIGAAVSARLAGISWSPPGAFHDDFLVKADKNPNTHGLRLQGLAPDGAVDELLGAADLRTLVLHRADLATWQGAGAALERVPYLVVLDTDLRETAEYANVVLPIGTYAESDGTFTNHAGRVQRFRPAVKPPRGADRALRPRRAHPGRVASGPPLLRPLLPARPHEPHATHQDPGRHAHGRADGGHGRGRGPLRARHWPRDDAPGHPDPLGPDRRYHRPLRAAPRGRHHDARRVRRQRAQRDRVPLRGHGAQRALRRLALLHRAPRVLPLQPAQPDPAAQVQDRDRRLRA